MNTKNLSFTMLAISLLMLPVAVCAKEKRTTLPPKSYDFVENPQSPVVIVHRAEPLVKSDAITEMADEQKKAVETVDDEIKNFALLCSLRRNNPDVYSMITGYAIPRAMQRGHIPILSDDPNLVYDPTLAAKTDRAPIFATTAKVIVAAAKACSTFGRSLDPNFGRLLKGVEEISATSDGPFPCPIFLPLIHCISEKNNMNGSLN